ncbi:MAG TPA: 6-bladed beta-propeller [Thermoanaerobaculia bacterium]|nr:6-bladed beta-propeller [Thermoanaerobaculia bacterium]HUM29122.1 6-bladed beta-propeller [Thermoanaerobaculia bacterium]HXK67499.1 6-bladed beta-propeller [Thermoanaerobaculia bacterium]
MSSIRTPKLFRLFFLVVGFLTLGVGLFAQQAPVVDEFLLSVPSVLPGGTVDLTVNAHDPDCPDVCTTGCGQTIRADLTLWSADGGNYLSFDNGVTGSPYTASALWEAPLVEGVYTLTISLSDSGTWMCGNRQTMSDSRTILVTSDPNLPPEITSLTASPATILINQTSALTCSASDPDGDPVTYTWFTDRGTIQGSGSSVVFSAPDFPGIVTITCRVTDDSGAFSERSVLLPVISLQAEQTLKPGLVTPLRVALDDSGYAFVADPRNGGIAVIQTTSSTLARRILVPGITSVDFDWDGHLLIASTSGARILDRNGALIRSLLPPGGLIVATDVAVDPVLQHHVVLYGRAGKVVVFDSTGSVLTTFGSIGDGTGQFKGATGLAVDSMGRILVGDRGHGKVHIFDATGTYAASIGDLGGGLGEFIQVEDVAADGNDAIFVTDSFQSRMQIFQPDGTPREVIGQYGDSLGQFKTPTGIGISETLGRVVVASLNTGSLQMFTMPGAIHPPGNTPPTEPVPVSPADGALIPRGSTVLLSVANSYDIDYQSLLYEFELYEVKNGALNLLQAWQVPEGQPATSVNASTWVSKAGSYVWRARAWDSFSYSTWCGYQTFQIDNGAVNHPPETPLPMSPAEGSETDSLVPVLSVQNAIDGDGDPLTYTFEVVLHDGEGFQTVSLSPAVSEGSGTTAWQVPAGGLALSQEVFWRARAFDGFEFSAWCPYTAFMTPPLPVPSSGEYGNLTGGDTTRPYSVYYELGPADQDTTLYFQVYDVTADGEVELEVNGTSLHTVSSQVANEWSFTISLTIPADELNPSSVNRLTFLHAGTDGWGIRALGLTGEPVPQMMAVPYNTVVDLSWSPDTGLDPGTEIRIFRSLSVSGPFVEIGTYNPSKALVRDMGLLNDQTYYYRAVYVDAIGTEGEPSAVVSAKPVSNNGPTPITDLKVTKVGDDVILTWTPVTSIPAIDRYEVYRDVLGFWTPDTSAFTNLLVTVDPFTGEAVDPGSVLISGEEWYEVIPLDTGGRRATQ